MHEGRFLLHKGDRPSSFPQMSDSGGVRATLTSPPMVSQAAHERPPGHE